MDTLTPAERSKRMSRVRGRNTLPELLVRKMLHRLGYRYRIHDRELPGRPDIVFPKRRKVIFVHGCFWHRHEHCKLASTPKSRSQFWLAKLEANRQRDERNLGLLDGLGWGVLVVWQCELKGKALTSVLESFLADACTIESESRLTRPKGPRVFEV